MTRGLITILCLLGALVFYFLGVVYAAMAAFIVGGCLELVFWVRAIGAFRRRPNAEV